MPAVIESKRIDNEMTSNETTSYNSITSSSNIGNGLVGCPSNGFWSKHGDDYNQLQKFWSELSPKARRDLLKINKQTLFEQARKNMYCSRCNGLLLEGFMQIVMYGKSLRYEGGCGKFPRRTLGISKEQIHDGAINAAVCQDETQDPSVHPWGGLVTMKDNALTLLDSYLYSKSLKGLQDVFDSARARERERELLYPDACGGSGRGWISQGIPSYGRGHGTRETCALHTARLSCDTLVDFWSALGEETRQSLLKMKEEDFIERLMYRFDSKRFCRDCRRNVIREFKELKELKRLRIEPRCTSWFCVADTAFQYEVSNDTICADWHQTFTDSLGTYHYFEWAVGSGEGKSDILEFENVGMNGSVRVNGLDLAGMTACYITLRAWKLDGRCNVFSVKAHALKGRDCVHCNLVVGDGYLAITHGESIRRFFEHAEEAEEEEDDDSMDKDGNDLDSDCSRPQKHAKSPELAREFLLDAATVIFKEQVEKAFREGTARQNAHSIFVCLALKLLEERINVARKEIVTLENQTKLLEEEEKEKREEEERKERKKTKEREKKLRRKERLREKEDKKSSESSESPLLLDISEETSMFCNDEDAHNYKRDSVSEIEDTIHPESPFPVALEESSSVNYTTPGYQNSAFEMAHEEFDDVNDQNIADNSKGPRRKWSDRRQSTDNGHFSENLSNGGNSLSRQSKASTPKLSTKNVGLRSGSKVQCGKNCLHSCGCSQQNDYKVGRYCSALRSNRDMPKPDQRINKYNQVDYMRDNCGRTRSKISNYSSALGRDSLYPKKVWEPVEPQKRYSRSTSNTDVTLKSCSSQTEEICTDKSMPEVCSGQPSQDFCGNGASDFSARSSSSSDNCSSCLSEGDSNRPSNHPNMEISVTSDSGDSYPQSEPQSSVCAQNGLPDDNKPIENEKVSGVISSGVSTVQHGVLPSICNQNISFPVFQGPSTLGYYHQSPLSWSTSPANGLMTYPLPNQYLFPSPFGYQPIHYGPVQHLPSPFISGNQIPAYQPIPRINCLDAQEQTAILKDNGVREPLGESGREYLRPEGNHLTEVPLKDDMKKGNSTKLDNGNTGFSLFQFGGPVTTPTFRSNTESTDEAEGDNVSSKKETTIEEYNLFATRNGMQFSIF